MPKYISPHRAHDREHFYKYVTANVAKTILVNHTLRWSSPLLFNDPFDVPRELDLGFSAEEIQELVGEEIARIIENPDSFDVSGRPRFHNLVQLLRSPGTSALRMTIARKIRKLVTPETASRARGTIAKLREQWASLLPQTRVLCLSEINDSTPMWSHYAGDNRGAVIEFECSDALDSPWLLARPITYQDNPPMLASKEAWVRSITGQQLLDFKKLFSEFWYVKTPDWAYEKEWRVVIFPDLDESGLYSDYAFNPRNISAVYLGSEISEQDSQDIRALLTHKLGHVSAYRSIPIQKERSLRFERIK